MEKQTCKAILFFMIICLLATLLSRTEGGRDAPNAAAAASAAWNEDKGEVIDPQLWFVHGIGDLWPWGKGGGHDGQGSWWPWGKGGGHDGQGSWWPWGGGGGHGGSGSWWWPWGGSGGHGGAGEWPWGGWGHGGGGNWSHVRGDLGHGGQKFQDRQFKDIGENVATNGDNDGSIADMMEKL